MEIIYVSFNINEKIQISWKPKIDWKQFLFSTSFLLNTFKHKIYHARPPEWLKVKNLSAICTFKL